MNKVVDISENIYTSGMPIFYISKYLGLAPFRAGGNGTICKFALSVPAVIASYIFGISLVALSIYGAINDMSLGKGGLKMTTTQSIVITFIDVFIVMFIAMLGIIGSPFKFSILGKFLTLLKEIDSIVNLTDGEKTRRNHFAFLGTILLFIIGVLLFTIYVGETSAGVKNYIAFYFMYIIVFVFECQYLQIVQSIRRRFKKFNECFKFDEMFKSTENHSVPKSNGIYTNTLSVHYGTGITEIREKHKFPVYGKELVTGKRMFNVTSVTNEQAFVRHRSLREYIHRLSEAHCKLFEAVDTVNETFGFTALIIITSCLFHLVTSPYFLLLDLLGDTNTRTAELVLQFFWIIAHFCRLLLIIEPCHSACKEAFYTNALVSGLLCSDIEDSYKRQLHRFALQLVHRHIEFSAFGLCTINRPLLSAIAGAITTYLVILLQFR